MIKICLFCKKEFKAPRKETQHCNRLCADKTHTLFMKRMKALTKYSSNCFICNKIIFDRPCHERKYCSRKCYAVNKSKMMVGANSYFWKGGITLISLAIRHSLEYEEWRKTCMERDLYTCQDCGQIGGCLEVDHIRRFAHYPELRFDVSNGRTLCKSCHRIKTTREQATERDKHGKFMGAKIEIIK